MRACVVVLGTQNLAVSESRLSLGVRKDPLRSIVGWGEGLAENLEIGVRGVEKEEED